MAEHAAVASVVTTIGKNRVGVDMVEKMSITQVEEIKFSALSLVHFNISGQKFMVSSELIKKHSESKLAAPHLLADHWMEDIGAFYFDRDPTLFNAVLNIFRYNVLNVPTGYDKNLVMEEINYWMVSLDQVSGVQDKEESRLEAEFQWLENRISPPSPNSNYVFKLRYKCWCFLTDPLGPHTEFRKMSITCALMTISAVVLYLMAYGLGTSAHYRELAADADPAERMNITGDVDAEARDAIGCHGIPKIECYVRSQPLFWIRTSKYIFMTLFISETVLRLLLCPGLAYFKSIITWLDIIAGICAIASFIFKRTSSSERELQYTIIFLESFQVLRVFKIFQYASLIDGLMIMMLTIKACLKELVLLVMYLMLAMFLFAIIIAFVELESDTGVGIPDCIYGYWWAIITMTTVGYGDFYPSTPAGYVIAVMCAITGIILTALPVAIIGSNFNVYWEHNKKRRQLLISALKRESEMNAKSLVKYA